MLNKILKGLIYSTIFLMPAFFLPFTFNVLEFNKLYLLFFLVWLSVIVWLLKMIVADKEFKIRHSKIDYAILAFAVIAIFSSIFSIDKLSSIFGNYGRFSTGLVGLLTLQAFYFLIVNNLGIRSGNKLQKKQDSAKTDNKALEKEGVITVSGIINSLLGSGFVIMFFAYFALFGVWRSLAQINSHWLSAINNLALRVSPVGGSIEIMALFLTVGLLLAVFLSLGGLSWTGAQDKAGKGKQEKRKKTKNIFIGVFIFLASILLIIADFNLAWLCLIVGLLAISIMILRTRVLKKEVHRLILPIALIIISTLFLILNFRAISATFPKFVLNSSPGFLAEQGLSQDDSWLIAGKSATCDFKSGLIGSGPGTFDYDFSLLRPKSMNQGVFWAINFDRPNSGVAEILATMGILGLLGFLVVVGLALQEIGIFNNFFSRPKKRKRRKIDAGTYFFSVLFLVMLLVEFFYYQTLALNFLFWLFLGVAVGWQYIRPQEKEERSGFFKETNFKLRDFVELALILETVCIILFLGFIILSFFGIKFYLADVEYASALRNTNLDQKAKILQQGIRLNPYEVRYQIVLSKVFLTKVQTEATNSKDKSAQDTIVQNLKLAQAFASNATALAPKNINAWQNLADINQAIIPLAKDNEQFAKAAITALRKVSELEPTNPKPYSDIGQLYLVLKKNDEAKAEFNKSISQKSDFAPANINIALMLEKDKEPDKAVAVLANVLKTNPRQPEVLFHLGRINYNKGNTEKAILAFNQAIALSPNYSNARYSLAMAYEKQGKIDEAIKELEIVAKANPGIKEIQDKINELKNSQSQPKETIKEPITDLQTQPAPAPIDNLGK